MSDSKTELQLPSNYEIKSSLKEGERVIDDYKDTQRGKDTGVAGQILLKDAKKLLKDGEDAVSSINEGEKVQHIAENGWGIVKDIAFDPNLQEMFFNWQSIASHITAGHDLGDLMRSSGDLLLSIRDSQKFIELLAELVKMLRLLVAERTEQVATFGTDNFKNAGKAEAAQIERSKEQAIQDLRGMIKQLSENETWNKIVRNSQKIADKVTSAAQQVVDVSKELGGDLANKEIDRVDSIVEDLTALLQRAVGDKVDITKLFDYTKRAVRDITEDERLPALFHEIQNLLVQCADSPSEIDTEATTKKLKESYESLQVVTSDLKENYNVRHAHKESKKLLEALKTNSTNNQLVADIQKLMFDVKSNRPGEVFDPNVLASLRQMLVPMLLDLMRNVPLPPVHDTFEFLGTYDMTLEDITISLPDLIPENIHVNIDYDMDANVRNLEATNQHVFVNIIAKNIQVHMHDVSWSYERQSTPKLHDAGKVSIDTGRRGVTLKLRMEAKSDPQRTLIEMLNVQAYTIDDWHITFSDSKHNTLYRVLTGVFSDTIKKEIRKAMEEKLMGLGKTVNDKLVETLYVAQKQGWAAAHSATTSGHNLTGGVKDVASSIASGVASLPSTASSVKLDLEHKALELAKDLILAGKIDAQTLSDIAQKGGEVASTVVDAVQNNAQAAGQKVAEVAKDGSDALADGVQAAGAKGGELAAKAGDKIESGAKQAGDAAASGARATGNKIGENAQPVGDKIADAAEKTGDKVAEGAKKAGDKIGEGAKQAGDKAAEGAEKAGSKAAEGARKAGEKAEEAGDKVAEKAPKAADKVAEKAEQAGDKAGQAARKAGDKAEEAGDKTKEVAHKAGDKAKEAGHQAGDKAQEAGHKAGDKAQEAGHKAGDKAQEAGHKAGDKAHEQGNKRHSQEHKAGDKAQEAGHKAGDKAEHAGEKVKEGAEKAGDKAKEVAHKAGDKAHEAGHQVEHKAEKAGEKVKEGAEKAGDKAKEVAHKAGDKAHEAGDKAKDAGHKTGDTAKDAGHQAGDKAKEAGHKAGDKAQEAGHKAGDKAQDAGQKTKEAGHKAGDKAEEAGHKAGEKAKEAGDKIADKSQEAGRQAHKAGDKVADKAEEAGHTVATKAKEAGDKVAEKAPAAGEKVAEKAQQAGQKTAEAARSTGEKVAQKAPEVGEKVAQKAENAGQAIGDKAKEAGRKASESLPKAGEKGAELVRNAGDKIASGAEKAGDAVANADVYGAVDSARDKVQGAGDSVASGLESLENKLRDKATEKGTQQSAAQTTSKASQGS